MKLKRELKRHEKNIDNKVELTPAYPRGIYHSNIYIQKANGINLEENIKQLKKKIKQASKGSDRLNVDIEKQV
jgi:hypothetical protein